MNLIRTVLSGCAFVLGLGCNVASAGELPLQHDGYLTFKGAPYSGDITLQFKLYLDGLQGHSEKQRVRVADGQYAVQLGTRVQGGDLANRLANARSVELAVVVLTGRAEVPLKPRLVVDVGRSNGAAAAGAISSEQLQDGSITGDKLAPGSVTRQALAPRIITNDYLQMVAVSGDNVRPETLTGRHILNDSITGFDIADGTLNEGHMQNPLRSRTYSVSKELVIPGGDSKATTVYCREPSDVLLAGSCYHRRGNLRGTKHSSAVRSTDNFYCRMENLNGKTGATIEAEVHATCLRQY